MPAPQRIYRAGATAARTAPLALVGMLGPEKGLAALLQQRQKMG